MEFYSPLRYPGGKGKVSDYFKKVFKENLLYDGIYVEPYAGGASVGLSLLFNEYASKIIINDIDKSLYSFWFSVLNHTDELCKLIRDSEINLATWESQKSIQKNKINCCELEVGFSTFFLNRTNRSGILKAGIIGGKAQQGDWKMDARFNKNELINRIQKIARYKSNIELHNLDAVTLINDLKDKLPSNTLFYFDPPYYVKGKDLYLNYYKDKDHQDIADAIDQIVNQKWIVTYDNVPQISKLYGNYRSKEFQLNYSAGSIAKKGNEIMIFSDNVFIAESALLV